MPNRRFVLRGIWALALGLPAACTTGVLTAERFEHDEAYIKGQKILEIYKEQTGMIIPTNAVREADKRYRHEKTFNVSFNALSAFLIGALISQIPFFISKSFGRDDNPGPS